MRDVNINSIRSIDRSIDILQAFTIKEPSLTLEELSKKTQIPKSTAYRILCTLERRGLIQFSEETTSYHLGLRLMEFSALVSSTLDVKTEAEETLKDLHLNTNQTILMAVKEGDQIIYIFKQENYEGLKFSSTVGQRQPFIYGVLGPILLAFSSASQIKRILNTPVSEHTPYTETDKDVIYKRLLKIKKDKIFIESNETNVGVTGIGAPVFGLNAEISAAIGIIGPQIQVDNQIDQFKPLLLESAQRISYKIGYKGDFLSPKNTYTSK